MNDIQIFNNEEFGELRTIVESGKVLFVAIDAARMLGYARPADAITAHCKGSVKRRVLTNGGEQEMKVIPEGDLYRLVAHSKLPSAEKFETWVFDEVLPSVRKTGKYEVEQSPEMAMARGLIAAQEIIKAKDEQIKTLTPKADFYDTVANSETMLSMSEVAKVLDMGYGRNKIFAILRDKKILDNRNVPYQQYVDRGYFKLVEGSYTNQGNVIVTKTVYVKQKGIDYIRKLLKEV